jgi:hypothetical protein
LVKATQSSPLWARSIEEMRSKHKKRRICRLILLEAQGEISGVPNLP